MDQGLQLQMEANDSSSHPDRRRRTPPWRRTVAAQALLCLGLYAAFSLGESPAKLSPIWPAVELAIRPEEADVFFLSVRGGARSVTAQDQLLNQLAEVAKVYKPKFVVNVGEFGEDDPLWRNSTQYFHVSKIPWYSTTSSRGETTGNFWKKIKMPHDQVLEIIGVDTGSLQHVMERSKTFREQIDWLQQLLAATRSNWRIVVGFDPLLVCNKVLPTERIKFHEPFRRIFGRYAVDIYLSTKACAGYFYQDNSTLHIGHPGPGDQINEAISMERDHNFTSEISDGFLLHRVTPLEIESYLITSEGKVVLQSAVYKNGRETM